MRRQILLQILVSILGAGFWYTLAGPQGAAAAVIGGGIALTATLVFAIRALWNRPGQSARSMLGGLYQAEALKLLVTAALFALAWTWLRPAPLPLLATFGVALSTNWLALLGLAPPAPNKHNGKNG